MAIVYEMLRRNLISWKGISWRKALDGFKGRCLKKNKTRRLYFSAKKKRGFFFFFFPLIFNQMLSKE